MREKELLLYGRLDCPREEQRLLSDMVWLMENWDDPKEQTPARKKALLCGCLSRLFEMAGTYGFSGNLWHCYLTYLLVNSENSYSRGCELGGETPDALNEAALQDMAIFLEFYRYDFGPMAQGLKAPGVFLAQRYEGDWEKKAYSRAICDKLSWLAQTLGKAAAAEEMKQTLTTFYREYGVGKLGLHKAFRLERRDGEVWIQPIPNVAPVTLDDLVGYETAKRKLRQNTEAFVAGRRANNCLLFGDAGTGKSSCVKALANEYYGRGLRIIELYKHQLGDFNQVMAQIKNRGYKFILYMDDLSFEEFETQYKYLKALIEGGLEKKPENVLIYATSNRRHLIRESDGDKEKLRRDMHAGETVQEKLSLAYRFGVSIYFGAPDKKQFERIVTTLADRAGIAMPREELLAQANKWELAHGGLSGRSARQFVDYLSGAGQDKKSEEGDGGT